MEFNFGENEGLGPKEEPQEEVQFRLGKITLGGTTVAIVLPVLFCIVVFLVVIGLGVLFVPHR